MSPTVHALKCLRKNFVNVFEMHFTLVHIKLLTILLFIMLDFDNKIFKVKNGYNFWFDNSSETVKT